VPFRQKIDAIAFSFVAATMARGISGRTTFTRLRGDLLAIPAAILNQTE